MCINKIISRYINKVDVLIRNTPTLEERFNEIEKLANSYFFETNTFLPYFIVEKLSYWYLKEVYSDKRTNKQRIDEYPILSQSQIYRRDRKAVLIDNDALLDNIIFCNSNHIPLKK